MVKGQPLRVFSDCVTEATAATVRQFKAYVSINPGDSLAVILYVYLALLLAKYGQTLVASLPETTAYKVTSFIL